MNRARRKRLAAILAQIDILALEDIKQDEENALDALPDSLMETERGQAMTNVIDALDDLLSGLEAGIDAVSQAAELHKLQ